MPMLDGVRLSMDDEQPRIIAPIDRLLGDQAFGEGIVKKVSLQSRPKELTFSTGLEFKLLAIFLDGRGSLENRSALAAGRRLPFSWGHSAYRPLCWIDFFCGDRSDRF